MKKDKIYWGNELGQDGIDVKETDTINRRSLQYQYDMDIRHGFAKNASSSIYSCHYINEFLNKWQLSCRNWSLDKFIPGLICLCNDLQSIILFITRKFIT